MFASDEDLKGYQDLQQYGMQEAWFTNGFDTIRMSAGDISALAQTIPAHPPYQRSQLNPWQQQLSGASKKTQSAEIKASSF